MTTEYISDGAEDVFKDNLETTATTRIKFLYNGQLGVITDDNGLYYMCSRYYNPEIKRFINQDILTGSIGNSTSLNRYSYVEGNPVSYTDPFGLSPFRTVHDVFHALYYIPVIGHGIAAVDSLIYLAEGEYTKAGVSAIYAIPGGTGVGLVIEATAGATAFFLPDDMVKNHDNPIIQDLYEYSHYYEMSKGQIALYTIINGISAYGELKVLNSEPVYEGDYIDFNRPEVRESVINKGLKDSNYVNAGGSRTKFDELLNSEYYKIDFGYDCSEIAEDFYNAADGQGKVYKIEGENGTINAFEYGHNVEYLYHEVYSDGTYIYDPRFSNKPVLKRDYFRKLREINVDGFYVYEKIME